LQSYSLFRGGILLLLACRGEGFGISIIYEIDGKGIDLPWDEKEKMK